MSLKIKIYCFVIAFVYLGMSISILYYAKEYTESGFETGNADIKEKAVHKNFQLNVVPKNGLLTFPENYKNESNGENIKLEISKYEVVAKVSEDKISKILVTLNKINTPIYSLLTIALLITPILFFSIIYTIVKKKEVITRSVILRARILGWIFILFFISDLLNTLINTKMAQNFLKLENYNVVVGYIDYTLLLIGLTILLLTEIQSMYLKLKEEQDLTI